MDATKIMHGVLSCERYDLSGATNDDIFACNSRRFLSAMVKKQRAWGLLMLPQETREKESGETGKAVESYNIKALNIYQHLWLSKLLHNRFTICVLLPV